MAVKILNKKENTRPKIKVLKKREPSLRAQKAVNILVEKGGTKGGALIEAGFSPNTAKTPEKVFGQPAVVELVDDVLLELKAHRTEVLKRMRETFGKASYGTLMVSLGILNKDIELLDGRPTQIQGHTLTNEQRERLEKLFKQNSQ